MHSNNKKAVHVFKKYSQYWQLKSDCTFSPPTPPPPSFFWPRPKTRRQTTDRRTDEAQRKEKKKERKRGRHEVRYTVLRLCEFLRSPSTQTNVTRTSPVIVDPCGVRWISPGFNLDEGVYVAAGACLLSLLAIYDTAYTLHRWIWRNGTGGNHSGWARVHRGEGGVSR